MFLIPIHSARLTFWLWNGLLSQGTKILYFSKIYLYINDDKHQAKIIIYDYVTTDTSKNLIENTAYSVFSPGYNRILLKPLLMSLPPNLKFNSCHSLLPVTDSLSTEDTIHCDKWATQMFCPCQKPRPATPPVLLLLCSTLHSENPNSFLHAASITALESMQGYDTASLKDV